MITIEFEEQLGITVPYPPIFDDTRKNNGFIDTRGRPELAATITEAKKSKALEKILRALSEENAPFFTLGCDLGTSQHPPADFEAGGYIQIMDSDYSDRLPNDYLSLAQVIAAELESKSTDVNWIVRLVHTPVQFNLDDFDNETSSLWIWFHAVAPTLCLALQSREVFIERLGEILLSAKTNNQGETPPLLTE